MQSSSQIITTNKPTSSFLQAGCPSCRPTNSVKVPKGSASYTYHRIKSWMKYDITVVRDGERISVDSQLPIDTHTYAQHRTAGVCSINIPKSQQYLPGHNITNTETAEGNSSECLPSTTAEQTHRNPTYGSGSRPPHLPEYVPSPRSVTVTN